jgi:hypothetical protein
MTPSPTPEDEGCMLTSRAFWITGAVSALSLICAAVWVFA